VNRNEFPINHFTRDIYLANPKTGAKAVRVFAEKDVLKTKEEEKYLMQFFKKNPKIEEAWFVMIPLPEEVKVFLYVDIIAPNKKTSEKSFYSFRYARFELYQFQNDVSKTEDKRITVHGKISPSVNMVVTLNNKELEMYPREKDNTVFTSKNAVLKTGQNTLLFQLTDKDGYTKTIKKIIQYVGVEVDANFVEEKETINDKVTISGTATPLSHVYIAIPVQGKRKVVSDFDVSQIGKFSVEVPVETGENTFWIYTVKDNKESPIITRKIIRKLSGEIDS